MKKSNAKLKIGNVPRIMGILNLTPDSFSDGGRYISVSAARRRAHEMIREGADIIDVGGESSGPGSHDVVLEEELRRVVPVLLSLQRLLPACRQAGACARNDNSHSPLISLDTYKSEVARQAIELGASIINDVTALRGDSRMAALIARTGVKIVLMYSKDETARTTRTKRRYKDVVKTVIEFLRGRIGYARAQGIKNSQIIIDPGMGAFISGEAKYSFEILRRLDKFKKLGFPILVGTSRKSFLPGALNERLVPSIVTSLVAVQNGADIIRVHDVRVHRQMLETFECYNRFP